MIRQAPGDLLGIYANGKFYYVLVLDRVRLFGGNLVFAFHKTTADLAAVSDGFRPDSPGFNAIVDLIRPKRDNRIKPIARGVPTGPFDTVRFFKQTLTLDGKAKYWRIVDREFKPVKEKVTQLSPVETAYPLYESINEPLLLERIDSRWTPDQDKRL